MASDKEGREEPPPDLAPYEFFDREWVQKWWVDKGLLVENDIFVVRGRFLIEARDEVLTYVLPLPFFEFQVHNEHAMQLFKRVNLLEYFTLPAWGMDLQSAWELVNSIDNSNNCVITGLDGMLVYW